MKKIRNLFILIALLGVIMPAWAEKIKGNGKIVTKEIPVKAYECIQLGSQPSPQGSFFGSKEKHYKTTLAPTFYYTQGDQTTLTLTTDENLLPYFEIEVKGKTLEIAIKEGTTLSPTELVFQGSSQALNAIKLRAGAYFYLQSALKGKKLEASVASGGEVYLNEPMELTKCETSVAGGGHVEAQQLTCEKVEVSIAGGGEVGLAGRAAEQEISMAGGGEVHAFDLIAEAVDVSCAGGGSAEVHATEQLSTSLVGGRVYYKGNPIIDTSNVGGKVRQAN